MAALQAIVAAAAQNPSLAAALSAAGAPAAGGGGGSSALDEKSLAALLSLPLHAAEPAAAAEGIAPPPAAASTSAGALPASAPPASPSTDLNANANASAAAGGGGGGGASESKAMSVAASAAAALRSGSWSSSFGHSLTSAVKGTASDPFRSFASAAELWVVPMASQVIASHAAGIDPKSRDYAIQKASQLLDMLPSRSQIDSALSLLHALFRARYFPELAGLQSDADVDNRFKSARTAIMQRLGLDSALDGVSRTATLPIDDLRAIASAAGAAVAQQNHQSLQRGRRDRSRNRQRGPRFFQPAYADIPMGPPPVPHQSFQGGGYQPRGGRSRGRGGRGRGGGYAQGPPASAMQSTTPMGPPPQPFGPPQPMAPPPGFPGFRS